jgi:hypothetical protein
MPDDLIMADDGVDLASAYLFALDQISGATETIGHPLGFIMLEQISNGQGGYKRVHIWRHDKIATPIPHSHSGHLRSTVLTGLMRNRLWCIEEADSGETPIVSVEKVGYNDRAYHWVHNARCTISATADYCAGQSYTIPAGVHHSSECLTEVCVTFVERLSGLDGLAQVARSQEEASAFGRYQINLARIELEALAQSLKEEAMNLNIRLPLHY